MAVLSPPDEDSALLASSGFFFLAIHAISVEGAGSILCPLRFAGHETPIRPEPLFFFHEARTVISDTILAPELVELGAVLGVAVGDYVSAVAAADDEDLPQFMIGQVPPMAFDVCVAGFEYHVTASQ